jgi:cysteine synthase A
MAYRLSREEGLFCRLSGGANVFVALKEARRLGKGNTVVTVLPDSGARYITKEVCTSQDSALS